MSPRDLNEWQRDERAFWRSFGWVAFGVVLLNLIFWGGLVAVIAAILNHYGVI